MIIASSDKGDRAFVLALLRVGVETFVKLGRHRKGNREKESNDRSAGDKGPLHGAASFCRSPGSRKMFLQVRHSDGLVQWQDRHLHRLVAEFAAAHAEKWSRQLATSASTVYQSASAQC